MPTVEIPRKVRVVVATRETKQGFFERTATGRSLRLYRAPHLELHLRPENRSGLPVVYNKAIEAARHDPAILVFMHDDVHLCDFYWMGNVLQAIRVFDIVGVVGNRRRVPHQPAWRYLDCSFTPDAFDNLTGMVGQGGGFPPQHLSWFGPSGQQAKLLDGLLLACASATLIDNDIRFDERFAFDFYDLDFCRQAERVGLKMGTWPISVVHESLGNFRSEAWRNGYRSYIEKWGE